MKKLLALALYISFIAATVASPVKLNTTTITGTLIGAGNKSIFVMYNGLTDTIKCTEEGKFAWSPKQINAVTMVQFKIVKGIQIPFVVAPGFRMNVMADALSMDAYYSSVKLDGLGALSNTYQAEDFKLGKAYKIPPLSDNWYAIPPAQFGKMGLEALKLDSLREQFKRKSVAPSEPYAAEIKKLWIDRLAFKKLYLVFAYADMNELSNQYIDTLITNHIEPEYLKSINHDELLGDYYYNEFVAFHYPFFRLNKLAKEHPEVNQNHSAAVLTIITELYKGKTKDFVLNRRITEDLENIYSQAALENIQPFIGKISDKKSAQLLQNKYEARVAELKSVAADMPAPSFSLPDEKGIQHSLKDMLGKVVYLDLWASWCGPCKEELPSLKKFAELYKGRSDFAIVSIAVKDAKGAESRKKVITNLGLDWLFLKDVDDAVWTKYKVLAIPRFILIGKDGKIIDFDAARPSETEKLKANVDKALVANVE